MGGKCVLLYRLLLNRNGSGDGVGDELFGSLINLHTYEYIMTIFSKDSHQLTVLSK